jgi:hypothetical protein
MAVLRSYQCTKHGYFDAWEAECPHGCKKVTQVFLKPFSIKSDRTKKADGTLKELASNFNMTNIKSTREGDYQTGYHTRNNKPEPNKGHEAANNGVLWGGGGRFDMGSALAGKAVQSVAGEPVGYNPKDMGNLSGPRASVVMNDHQGLKLNADTN